ncbi:hypothetical protein PMSD_22655 [Paenibacillus macquariensis subsp. defensor]|nr:hypothetical protein PMSD_22655 [Paenibacillus macquariensis subsp. defensor]
MVAEFGKKEFAAGGMLLAAIIYLSLAFIPGIKACVTKANKNEHVSTSDEVQLNGGFCVNPF